MRNIKWSVLGFLFVIGLQGSKCALAQDLSTVSYVTTSPIPLTLTDFNGTLAFQQFDSSLGNLVSVDIAFTTTLQTQLTITNNASGRSGGTAYTEVDVALADPDGYLPNPQFDPTTGPVDGSFVGSTLSPGFRYQLNSGVTAMSGMLQGSSLTDASFAAPDYSGLLTEFTGSGVIDLTAFTSTSTVLSNSGGNTIAQQVTQAAVTGTVTYTYSPPTGVPEPAALALLSSGLVGGLALVRRRK